jgi:hypothetical protein
MLRLARAGEEEEQAADLLAVRQLRDGLLRLGHPVVEFLFSGSIEEPLAT